MLRRQEEKGHVTTRDLFDTGLRLIMPGLIFPAGKRLNRIYLFFVYRIFSVFLFPCPSFVFFFYRFFSYFYILPHFPTASERR